MCACDVVPLIREPSSYALAALLELKVVYTSQALSARMPSRSLVDTPR
jgi:hypothetical protein